jgi:hypothetical protein
LANQVACKPLACATQGNLEPGAAAAAACDGRAVESQRFPLPATFRSILARHVGLAERLSYAALTALADCAPEDEDLQILASSYEDYSSWAKIVRVRDNVQAATPATTGRGCLALARQGVPPRQYHEPSQQTEMPQVPPETCPSVNSRECCIA